MRCYALGCFEEVSSGGDGGGGGTEREGACPWTCEAHQDFFRFERWIQSFGPMVYNKRGMPTVATRGIRGYIEFCLQHCVRDITPEHLQAMYFVEEDRFDEFPEGDCIIASYILDYCRILFRRPDVSPVWNKNLFCMLVKQVLLNCLPHRLGCLPTELGVFLRHPLVERRDVLTLLARLRHSHPSIFALGCTREAWQDILEAVFVPELVGNWIGCKECIEEEGTLAVKAAIPFAEGQGRAQAQWDYETKPFLLDYVEMCEALAKERFASLRDELLAVALHPDRGREWLLDEGTAGLWHE
jgi:hypothetical protein